MFKASYLTSLLVFPAVLFVLPDVAFAYGETPQSKITGITITSQAPSPTNLYMRVSGTFSNPDSCPSDSGIDIAFSATTNPNYKDMEAAVYAAYTSGKTIGFWVNGCDGYGYPLAYVVVLPSE